MITIKAGKLFIEKYNEVNGTSLTPKEVFCMLATESFKGGRDLTHWFNSKFSYYRKAYNKFIKGKKEQEPSFDDCLHAFCDTLENEDVGLETSLNVYGGCGIKGNEGDVLATTEFNFCDNLHFSVDERYCSFIGSFFQMNVSGFKTVINNKEVIWLLYESFKKYRKYIHNNDDVKDNQLLTWNGWYFYEKCAHKQGFVQNRQQLKDAKTLNYLEFLEAMFKSKLPIARVLMFDILGSQGNTSAGCVTIDLDDVQSWLDIMDKVVSTMDNEFNLEKYSELFSKGMLLRMSLERGETTSDMLDPLYEFKRERREFRKDENKERNKTRITFLKKYLTLIMSEKEMELSKRFGEFLTKAPKESKKNLTTAEEVKNIINSPNIVKFGKAVMAFCQKIKIDPKETIAYEVVTYFTKDSTKLQEFLMYTNFNL